MRATYCYANGFKSRTAGGPATPAAILSRQRRYRHAPCRDFPCLMRLWPGSPTATARPGRACCRASSGSAVRLIEASAPLRERASAGISDPHAGDVDHPPTSVHVLGLLVASPVRTNSGMSFGLKPYASSTASLPPISTAGEQFEGAAMVGLRHPQTVAAQPECRQALLSPLPPEPPLPLPMPDRLFTLIKNRDQLGTAAPLF